jgi:hypothetical protein
MPKSRPCRKMAFSGSASPHRAETTSCGLKSSDSELPIDQANIVADNCRAFKPSEALKECLPYVVG